MKCLIAILVLALGLPLDQTANAQQFEPFQEIQAAAVKALRHLDLENASLYLYSLDPKHRQNIIHTTPGFFHGYPVLGKTQIKPGREKRDLVEAFIDGVSRSEGIAAACFEPRHGLRVILEGRTTDFVACYSCLSIEAFNFGGPPDFLTDASPMNLFNQFLDRYHLKRDRVEP